MEIKNIAVIGSGTMGNGISHVFALNGYNVTLIDIKPELLEKAISTIKGNLERQVKKEAITPEQLVKTLSNIKTSTNLSDAKDCELVIEAATENIAIKKSIFETLESSCKPEAILATNTSSISITEIAAFTKRPDKVIG
ncbi:MAG: 3-hydroxyacyl-CoA dehydrogenase family protein, partial [Ignavibacteria bacterium]